MAITGSDFLLTPVRNFPYIMRPLTNITPFTYEDGTTYLEILTLLDTYIRKMGPDVDVKLKELFDEFQAGITNAENTIIHEREVWQALFDNFMSDIVVQLEGLNDQAVANLVETPGSKVSVTLNSKFANKSTQLTVETGRLSESSITNTVKNSISDGINTGLQGPLSTVASVDELSQTVFISCWRESGTDNAIMSSKSASAPAIWVAPFTLRIVSCVIVFDRMSHPLGTTDYMRFKLRKRPINNSSIFDIAEKTTASYNGVAIAPRVPWDFSVGSWTIENSTLLQGETLALQWEWLGSSLKQLDFPFSITFRYVPA